MMLYIHFEPFFNTFLWRCWDVNLKSNILEYNLWWERVIPMHCVKSVRIRSYAGTHFSRIFPHSDWIRRDTPYLFVFSPNAGKSRKNADQNNSEYVDFLGNDGFCEKDYREYHLSGKYNCTEVIYPLSHNWCGNTIQPASSQPISFTPWKH